MDPCVVHSLALLTVWVSLSIVEKLSLAYNQGAMPIVIISESTVRRLIYDWRGLLMWMIINATLR